MENHKIKVIQHSDIEGLAISPALCVEWARGAFLQKDEAQMPAKLSVHPQGEDFITTMPCLLPAHHGRQYFGVKIVSRIEGQMPIINSNISLYDAATGKQLAIIDGNWITAMRTGAVAALAAETFQTTGTDNYSMMGLGNIARAVALCLIAVNSHRHINIQLLRYKDQAEQFVERFSNFDNVSFSIIDDKQEFVSHSDVLISCVTLAKELLFPDNSLFRKGITVIPVHMRGFQNCDFFFDKVYGDDTRKIQDFKYFSRFRQYDELHHVLQGKNPGRVSDEERIISYNYGLALHDVFFAAKIYEMLQDSSDGFFMTKPDKKIWL
jgi:ornithine cyclodeaminase